MTTNEATASLPMKGHVMAARTKAPTTPKGPTKVQATGEVSLDDVLANIDLLDETSELDAVRDDVQLIEDMDGDGSDFVDEGAAERAGIPKLGAVNPAHTDPNRPAPKARKAKVAKAPAPAPVRHARMSHKDCGHATQGEAGKLARAACRAAHRGQEGEAVAS